MIKKLEDIYQIVQKDFRNGVHYIEVEHNKMSDLMLYIYEHMGFIFLVDIFAIDLKNTLEMKTSSLESSERFQVSYLLKNMNQKELLCVQVKVGFDDILISQASLWLNSFAKEMEVSELFGIRYNFEPQKILLDSLEERPMLKDFSSFSQPIDSSGIQNKNHNQNEYSEELYQLLQLSPSHYLRKYDLDFFIKLIDDQVDTCIIRRGYNYSGIEKICETLNVEQIVNFSDKFNPLISPVFNVLWADTVEKLHAINIPERAMGIRMIMLELCRILDHFYTIAMMAYELDFQKYYKDMLFYIERINRLISLYCGSVSATSFTCIGGVRFEIPDGWISLCQDELEKIQVDILEFASIVKSSSVWKNSLLNGRISAQEAIQWGLGGPNLRASGVNFDLRKRNPYYFYGEVDFEIPVGQKGESLDRYLVRLEEVFQSIRIINQVLDNMPTGDIISKEVQGFHGSKFNRVYDKSFTEHNVNPMIIPATQIYNAMEAPGGESGLYVMGSNKKYPYRLKLFSSSSNAVAGVPVFLRGYSYREVLLIYSSLNIHMKEVER